MPPRRGTRICQLAAVMVITEADKIDISNAQCRRRQLSHLLRAMDHRFLSFTTESGHVRRRIMYETYLISAGLMSLYEVLALLAGGRSASMFICMCWRYSNQGKHYRLGTKWTLPVHPRKTTGKCRNQQSRDRSGQCGTFHDMRLGVERRKIGRVSESPTNLAPE